MSSGYYAAAGQIGLPFPTTRGEIAERTKRVGDIVQQNIRRAKHSHL